MQGTAQKYSTSESVFIRQPFSLLAILFMLITIPGLLQADVTASLDRDTIYTGDTVTLRITATGDQQGEQPDLTPLQKDFSVVGTSSSRRIQIINGKRSDKDEWLIELAPIGAGAVSIPPLNVRNGTTPALTIQVNEQPEASTAQAGQPVFVSAEINPPRGDTYVQQQILYTTRLYYNVPLIKGSLSDPRIENAVVEQLGKDQQYKTTIDDQSYQVVERRYAVFPEHSGELTIGPTLFSGRTASIPDQRSRLDSMDNIVERMLSQRGISDTLVGGKRLRVRSDVLTLNIKPRPDVYTGAHWLPNQKLVLQDSWVETPPIIRAGEPVTRILTLEAKGLEASQLPNIRPAESDTLRIYPEQPDLSNRSDGDWIYGRSDQRFTYVATQPGKLTLPEVRIDWWDSINHKQQTAVLPAREVIVEPGTGQTTSTDIVGEAGVPANKAPVNLDDTQDTVPLEQYVPNNARDWMVGGGLIVLAVLVVLGLMRKHRSPAHGNPRAIPAAFTDTQPTSNSTRSNTLAHTRRALQNACSRNDAQAAARALLDWAAATWPQQPPRSLGALAGHVDRGADAIRELESILYSVTNDGWTGQPLWQAFTDGLQTRKSTTHTRQANNNSAPPLYPDWNQKSG